MKEIRMVVLGLVVVLLIALVMAGQTAVNRVADYRELTAAKSLHQLTLEARAEPDGRGGVLLAGAGLAALALLFVGVPAFFLPAGREFGRGMGRRRRKPRPTPTPQTPGLPELPRLRVLPPAPHLTALPPTTAEEGRYEDRR
jgi:hypothetical protein